MLIKKCKVCQSEFKTYPSVDNEACSKKCGYDLKKLKSYQKYKCTCRLCKKEFLPTRQKEGAIYCSYKCRGIDERHIVVRRGGYDYLYIPSHKNSSKQGYIAQHRIIYERMHGIVLSKHLTVHHRDENILNNNLSNLELMSNAEHSSHHMKENHKNNKIWTNEFKEKHKNSMLKNKKCKRNKNDSSEMGTLS
jgi:hypothetical protein